jgi:predicted ATPase
MLQQLGQVIAPTSTPTASKGDTRSLGQNDCRECGDSIDDFVQECVAPDFGDGLWYPWYPVCPNCLERLEGQAESNDNKPSARKKYEDIFMEMCPLSMQETDASRLNPAKLNKVLEHQVNGRGIIMHGKTGMGKTRVMWLLIRELVVNRMRDVRVFDVTELKEALAQSHNSRYAHKDLIEGLCRCDVLCIDDLGKEKASDAWEQDLFSLVDRRALHKKPLIITTNFVGDSLKSRYTDIHRAEPMVRKLKDSCDSVCFDRYPT